MIKGCGWDYFDFIKALPNKKMIDEVCPDKPVFLESYCQHHIWLNSKALEMAGITKDTPNPHMGLIWRDKNGEPMGLLSEFSAINIVKPELFTSIWLMSRQSLMHIGFRDFFSFT